MDAARLLKENLARVEERITAACRRAGRKRDEVTLVAVTKSVTADVAGLLPGLGVRDLGESRPQELWKKAAVLPQNIRWHLVGHLQRNKIERTLPIVELIHSVDSLRLLLAIDEEAYRQQRTTRVLLEINAGEANKQGFSAEDLPSLALSLEGVSVRVAGLMTMAPLQAAEACRPVFARLRQLRDEWQKKVGPYHPLTHLSMGMSNDFEVAIEEGATMVRLGTVLFEGLSR